MTTASVFKVRPTLEQLNALRKNTLVEHLDIQIIEFGEDFMRGRMPVHANTHQPYGLLHGGASVALAETLGSIAGAMCIDQTKQMAVGLEINANHLRAVTSGFVIGTARPVHVGRNTQVWDIRIEDEAGKAVCVSRLTLAVIPKP